ncbi:MAG: MGMT family protein [Fibrobacteres bacterium]|nr:MGMT family protein [Fibrobacterota bacterium]
MRKSPTKSGAKRRPAADGRTAKTRAPLTERIVAVIKAIPKGTVASYGQVAALAGSPRGARQVARVLHSLSGKEKLPWHRVIGAAGSISLPAEGGAEQARRLRREGVPVDARGRLDLARFLWKPA